MLHLEIQSSQKPKENPVSCCKIRRGINLVDSPFLVDVSRVVSDRKGRALYNMSELKDDARCDPTNDSSDDKAYQSVSPTPHNCRYDNVRHYITDLGDPENEVAAEFHLCVGGHMWHELFREVSLEVPVKNPCDVGESVKKYPIPMLKSVKPVPGLVLVEPHEGSDVDVRIVTFNVCVRMMVHVVFNLPYVCIASKHIQCVCGDRVQPRVLRKTLVAPLVHDVKPDHGEVKPKYDAEQGCPQPRQGEEYHHHIYRKR